MERDWLAPFASLVLLEWLAAHLMAWSIGYPSTPDYSPQFGFMTISGFVAVFSFFVFHILKLMRAADPHPAKKLLALARANCLRFAAIGVGLACAALHVVAFNWMKSMLPYVVPFWADVPLAELDLRLFGMHAWQWALGVAGPTSAFFYWAYVLWMPIHLILPIVVMCSRPSDRRSRLLLAYLLTWLLGGLLSFLFSSAGPLFYGRLGFGNEFDALASQPHIQRIPFVADYLWKNYILLSADPGAGISAFPSLHVATAVWIAVAIRHWIAWVFAAAIFFGSFLLGWHYFLDAPGGVLVAICALWISTLYFSRARSRASREIASLARA